MFINPFNIFNWILVIAAIVPAVFLMIWVYKKDRLEPEPTKLMWGLALMGVLSTQLALLEENVGEWLLGVVASEGTRIYNIILYFVIVAVAEETSKYIFLKAKTWKNPNFNYTFDAIVYAVFVSLGFALWENIEYVLMYGFGTALVRAFSAIPGHASFGVFMGIFYGLAKKYEMSNDLVNSRRFRRLSVIVPVLVHGAYDYIATLEETASDLIFLVFIIIVFAGAFIAVKRESRNDRHIA